MSAREPPCSQLPGPWEEGGGAIMECEYTLTMSMAFMGWCCEFSSSAGDTFIG